MRIKKKGLVTIIGLLLSVTTAFGDLENRLVSNKYTIDRVVDGDTVLLTNKKYVRLAGIDAPEVKGVRYRKNQPGSIAATNKLDDLIKQYNNEVILERYENEPEYDKYDRLLGDLYVTKDNKRVYINYEMVRNGYAKAKHFGDIRYNTKMLKNAESYAKNENIGIWK